MTYSRTADGVAEWYGMATCVAEVPFVIFGIRFVAFTESSVANGISMREGAG